MTNSQKVVIPAQAGIQAGPNQLIRPLAGLDSRFHGNDEYARFRAFYELVKDRGWSYFLLFYTFSFQTQT